MAARWLIHSRDRTFGPWTAIQVRDELRAGRIDPFDMACKEGSTLKRPLVEVDEIFQSSRVQMAELVDVADDSADLQATRTTKRATNEPAVVKKAAGAEATALPASAQDTSEPMRATPPPPIDRPRPSQFQALAAAARLEPPGNLEARKPKQYFVTDSTGRSYGPLSSGEVMKLWHSGRIDSRAVVERGNSTKRINIQKFVDFYQRAAPSGVAFLNTQANRPIQARYITVVRESTPKSLILAALLFVAGALLFLGTTVRDHLPHQVSRFFPKAKITAPVQRFDLKAIDTITGNSNSAGTDSITPRAPEAAKANNIEVIQARPSKAPSTKPKSSSKPPQKVKAKNKSLSPRYRSEVVASRLAPASAPVLLRPPLNTSPPSVIASTPETAVDKPRIAAPTPIKAFVDGSTMTLANYRFAPGDVASCEGKCKIAMSGSMGPVTAIFFKEAMGGSFRGKSSVTISGTMRKQSSGAWSIIVSSVR